MYASVNLVKSTNTKMESKKLKYKKLDGISEKQLSEHHDVLYVGYVNKVAAIDKALNSVNLEGVNATFSDLRELKIEETFAVNGVKLHEAYFDNLGGNGLPSGKITELIKRDFGSIDSWKKEFMACGLAARGWVVLAFDLDTKKLRNVVCDLHNQGGVWNCVSLLVLDVYEHAYFIDFATARAKYIDVFMKNIDWADVNSRLKKFKVE